MPIAWPRHAGGGVDVVEVSLKNASMHARHVLRRARPEVERPSVTTVAAAAVVIATAELVVVDPIGSR